MKKNTLLFSILFLSIRFYGQIMDWVPVMQGFDWPVRSLSVFNASLIASGDFKMASGTQVNRIAAWNGSSWTGLGQGIPGSLSYVTKTIVFNNELYAVGKFDSAGTVPSKNIAKWNGANWVSLATSGNGIIFDIAIFNNQIHVAGSFTNVNGVSANRVAKWTGSNWEALGSGIDGTNVNALYTYQNALYAVGVFTAAGGVPCNQITRWNGAAWSNLSGGVPYGNGGMIEWQGKLLIGANNNYTTSPFTSEIHQWDGSNISLFSQQQVPVSRNFLIFNNKLYNGSTPSIWNESSSLWEVMSNGVVQVYSLFDFNGEIYCVGNFKISSGSNADYIAKWGTPTNLKNYGNNTLNVSLFPNPVKEKLTVDFAANIVKKITITNSLGRIVFEINNPLSKQLIDLSILPNGLYFLKTEGEKAYKVFKIVKE